MSDSVASTFASDRQKAKLLTFFCILGLAGFLLNLIAGYALWTYNHARPAVVPTFDAFVFELKRLPADKLSVMTTDLFEKWSACAGAQAGWTEVTTHALITSSVIGAALFAVCSVLAWQIYGRLSSLQQFWAPPQPPDALNE